MAVASVSLSGRSWFADIAARSPSGTGGHRRERNSLALALVSLDSTMRSNISVGPPLELSMYDTDSLDEPRHMVFSLNSPMYKSLQKRWNEGLRRSFNRLPRFDWEDEPG